MKECKYCKNPGKFYPVNRKVLCKEHAEPECQRQFRNLWEAVADIQLKMPRNY